MTPQKDAHTHRLRQQLAPKVPWEGSGWMSSAKHRLIKQADQSTGKSHGPTVLDPGLTRSSAPSSPGSQRCRAEPAGSCFTSCLERHTSLQLNNSLETGKGHPMQPHQELPGWERLIILPCSVLCLSSVPSSSIQGAARRQQQIWASPALLTPSSQAEPLHGHLALKPGPAQALPKPRELHLPQDYGQLQIK